MRRAQETFAVAGILATLLACGASLNASDRAELATDGVRITTCAGVAVKCGDDAKASGRTKEEAAALCWPVFDACRDDAGITPEGGKR